MSQNAPTLHILCGKIASGKSTLSTKLGRQEGMILIAEDAWLKTLYADDLSTMSDYVRCASRLRGAMEPHIVSLLTAGLSVVLDFQANTVEARAWMRGILNQTNASHVLHLMDVPDEVCLDRLRIRNAQGDHPFTVSDEQFRQFSKYFAMPSAEEGFTVVVHNGVSDT